jgi:oxygen-dependent protoporphyrinogen oxidase
VKRIAIVGGGIAGLAAARAAVLRAREKGEPASIVVLERAPRFGGKLVTERVDGFLLDAGADSWVVTKPQATALARALGLGGSLLGTRPENRRYLVAWGGRLHPVPEGLVLGVPTRIAPLVTTRLFSWRGKARMAWEPFVPARHFHGDDDESIADFATRRLGAEAADRLVAPLLGGISAGDASEISVRAAFPQLIAMEEEHGSLVRGMRVARRARASAGGSAFMSLEGGTGELVDALVAWLGREGASGGGGANGADASSAGVVLRPGVAVEGLAREGAAWTVALEGGERVVADRVLLAVPATAAEALLAPLDEPAARAIGTIGYGTTATVFLGYRRADVRHPLDGVGFVVPRGARRPILASTWVSSKWEGRAPEGHVLVRAFLGGPWAEALLAEGDDALVAAARAELASLMGIDAEPTMVRTYRFAQGSAQMRVGHVATMRRAREGLAASAPGVRIAGGGYDGVGIPDCIRQGEDAGKAMVDR